MPRVRRYDRASTSEWAKLPNGYLRATASIARADCVQEYTLADGTRRREFRPSTEVFHVDAMGSFSLLPLTSEHPPVLLTAENTKDFQVGSVGENLRQDGDKVVASILVTDATAVADLLAGRRREVSCGYVCELEATPGEFNGQRYDAIQRGIRGNHVALTVQGRAGPQVRVHLDSTDAVQSGLSPADEPQDGARGDAMEKVQINGVWVELPAQAAQLLAVEREQRVKQDSAQAESIKAAQAAAETAKAKADAAEAKAAAADKARTDATADARIHEMVTARLALLDKARAVLGTEGAAKLDSTTAKDIQLAVLKALAPEKSFEGTSEEHVAIWFDAFTAGAAKAQPTAAERTRAIAGAPGGGAASGAEAAYAKLHEGVEGAWKTSGTDLLARLAR